MIVTVTMNPAVDKTAMIPALVPHGLNRLRDVVQDVGGKGINVSKTIAALGGHSLATGLLAGATGKMIWNTLQQMKGVEPRFLFVEGQTRTNLKLVEPNGMLTELNEQGPTVTEAARLALAEQIEQLAQPGTLFVIAGSVSGGVPAEFYRDLIERIHAKGATVFLDADGELFRQGVKACPDIIKPNAFDAVPVFWPGDRGGRRDPCDGARVEPPRRRACVRVDGRPGRGVHPEGTRVARAGAPGERPFQCGGRGRHGGGDQLWAGPKAPAGTMPAPRRGHQRRHLHDGRHQNAAPARDPCAGKNRCDCIRSTNKISSLAKRGCCKKCNTSPFLFLRLLAPAGVFAR